MYANWHTCQYMHSYPANPMSIWHTCSNGPHSSQFLTGSVCHDPPNSLPTYLPTYRCEHILAYLYASSTGFTIISVS